MALCFVLDEHLRGLLWRALQQHNQAGAYVVDVIRVGDPADLPLGTKDPDLLLWTEAHGRILLSKDVNTMPGYFAAHLQQGRHSPGILLIPPCGSLRQIIFHVALTAHAGDPADYADRITYLF